LNNELLRQSRYAPLALLCRTIQEKDLAGTSGTETGRAPYRLRALWTKMLLHNTVADMFGLSYIILLHGSVEILSQTFNI